MRPRPFKSFRDRTYMVGMSPQSLETAGRLGLGCMKFAQGPWEEAKADVDRHRALFKQSQGFEPPPPIAADCMVCDTNLKRAETLAREHVTRYWVQLMDHYEYCSVTTSRRREPLTRHTPNKQNITGRRVRKLS